MLNKRNNLVKIVEKLIFIYYNHVNKIVKIYDDGSKD